MLQGGWVKSQSSELRGLDEIPEGVAQFVFQRLFEPMPNRKPFPGS
jgi:hypothetical protein